jgi:hypothetical protein
MEAGSEFLEENHKRRSNHPSVLGNDMILIIVCYIFVLVY